MCTVHQLCFVVSLIIISMELTADNLSIRDRQAAQRPMITTHLIITISGCFFVCPTWSWTRTTDALQWNKNNNKKATKVNLKKWVLSCCLKVMGKCWPAEMQVWQLVKRRGNVRAWYLCPAQFGANVSLNVEWHFQWKKLIKFHSISEIFHSWCTLAQAYIDFDS